MNRKIFGVFLGPSLMALASFPGVIALCGIGPANAAPAHADTVYINGKVYTANAKDTVAQGFAISGDRFVAVGSDADVKKYVGPGTNVVNLKGHFVSPGLASSSMPASEIRPPAR